MFLYIGLIIYILKTFFQLDPAGGTQRQFLENICSEDDFRNIFCMPASPKIFERLKNGIIAHF